MKKKRNKKRTVQKKRWQSIGAGVLALVMIAALAVGLLPENMGQVYAAEDYTKAADGTSVDSWQEYLTDENKNYTTENIGRIWTDKTVTAGDFTFTEGTLGEQQKTISADGSDFVVALSALSSTSNLTVQEASKPLDIVLVLDLSGSMADPLSPTEVYSADLDHSKTYWIQVTDNWGDTSWERVKYETRQIKGWGYEYSETGWFLADDSNSTTTYTPKTNAADRRRTQFYESESSRMEALKTAVNNFIDATAAQNDLITDASKQHEISIVKFAGQPRNANYSTIGDDFDNSGYNYTQRVTELAAYDSTSAGTLKTRVNNLKPAGGTRAHYGLKAASAELAANARSDAQQVIIFFTDGEPNNGSGFHRDVAAAAVNEAKTIKTYGTLIYTIGVFEDADPADTTVQDFNKYMHGVSSNYPSAYATSSGTGERSTWALTLGERVSETSAFYKAATNAGELNNIFNEISGEISEAVTGVPTQTTGGAHETDGYITFTDQLGDYMQVDGFKSIVYNNQIYSNPTYDETAGTYEFTAEVKANNPNETEMTNLNKILIKVTKGSDAKTGDTVEVKVPASLIPLREFSVESAADGTTTMKVSEAFPLRIFYGVSIKKGIVSDVKDENGNITAYAAIDNPDDGLKAYLEENTIKDENGRSTGQVAFYSNKWTLGKEDGDTTAVFDPARNNTFYYFAENTYVYSDEECTRPVTRADGINADGTYYYQRIYYVGNADGTAEKVVKVSTFPGANFSIGADNYGYDADGKLYIAPKAHRVSTINNMKTDKTDNSTATAETIINPTWVDTNEGNLISVALGNNGVLTTALPGALAVSKTVDVGEGLNKNDYTNTAFDFTITLKDGKDNEITGDLQAAVKTGTVTGDVFTLAAGSDGSYTYSLKDGQTLYLYGLDAGTKYTVTEAGKAGFTASVNDASGEKGQGTSTDGAISAGETAEAAFTNIYHVDSKTLTGAEALQIRKNLTGRDWDSTDSFEFVLDAASYQAPGAEKPSTDKSVLAGMPMPAGAVNGKAKMDVTSGDVTSFGDIVFTKPGTYVYTISETTPVTDGLPGVDYSTAVYRVTVTVTDNKDGTLSVSSNMVQTYDDEGNPIASEDQNEVTVAVITNSFATGNQSLGILATKTYTDNSGANGLAEGKFQFKLKAAGDNAASAPMPVGQTPDADGYVYIGNADNGSVAFPNITFTSADHDGETFTYELSEVMPTEATAKNGYTVNGMKYDPSVYTVEVSVNVNREGVLEVTPVYKDADGNEVKAPDGTTAGRAYFDNSYTPQSVTLSDEKDTAIKGTKTLTGRNMKEDEFEFTLSFTGEANGRTNGVTIVSGAEKARAGSGLDGEAVAFYFENVTFTKPGTYFFEVKETIPTPKAGGMTYDGHTAKVTVVVTDNDGVLTVTGITYDNSGADTSTTAAVFRNTYKAEGTYKADGTNAGLTFTKTLTGRSMAEKEFTFTLEGVDEASKTKLAGLTAEFQNESADSGTARDITVLKDLKFDEKDAGKTYKFLLDETEDGKGGVDYDQSQYEIHITVTDEGDGTISSSTEIYQVKAKDGTEKTPAEKVNSIAFANTYAASGTVSLSGTKTLTGREFRQGDSFTFTLEALNGAPMPDKVDENHTVTIAPSAGTSAAIDFGSITFTAEGTYTYKIKESESNISGIMDDTAEKTVTFTVKDVEKTGMLTVTPGPDNGANLTWQNQYTAAPTTDTVSLTGTKNLTVNSGAALTLGEHDFAFTVTTLKDGRPYETAKTVYNEAGTGSNGSYTAEIALLENVSYNEAGTYVYLIQEGPGTVPGMTYDSAVYQYTVVVEDDGNGQLVINDNKGLVKGTLEEGVFTEDAEQPEQPSVVFNNSYSLTEVKDIQNPITVTKKLSGRALKAGEFTFRLEAGDEATSAAIARGDVVLPTVMTADNNENGTAVFGTITYKAIGDYTFNVSEVVPADADKDPNITYSNEVYTVTAAVIQAENGQAGLTMSYTPNNVTITNAYHAEGTLGGEADVKIEASKTLTGRDMLDGEFHFVVKDNTGKEVSTGTSAAARDGEAGEITFAPIAYSTEELQEAVEAKTATYDEQAGEYRIQYTVSEDTEGLGDEGITPSVSSFIIIVTLTDDGHGTLTPSVNYPAGSNDTLGFVNTYGASEAPLTISGKKSLALADPSLKLTQEDIAGKYSFTITGEDENGKIAPLPDETTVENDEQGNVTFGPIKYTLENVFGTGSSQTTTDDKTDAVTDETLENPGTVDDKTDAAEAPTDSEDGTKEPDADTPSVDQTDDAVTDSDKKADETVETPSEETKPDDTALQEEPAKNAGEEAGPADGTDTIETDAQKSDEDNRAETLNSALQMLRTNGMVQMNVAGNAGGSFRTMGSTDMEPLNGMDENTDGDTGEDTKTPAESKVRSKTFTYTVTESGSMDGVTNDTESSKTFKVTVTDDGKGSLSVSTSYEDMAFSFTNTYDVDPKETSLTGEGGFTILKKLAGRTLKAEEFTFELKAEDGTTVSSGKNAADGTVVMSPVTFEKPGIYSYRLAELNAGKVLNGVTYDGAGYNVTATVEDNKDATMSVVWSVEGLDTKEISFTNTYKAPEQPKDPETSGKKHHHSSDPAPAAPAPSAAQPLASPQTGDDAPLLPLIATIIITLAAIVAVVMKIRKGYKRN